VTQPSAQQVSSGNTFQFGGATTENVFQFGTSNSTQPSMSALPWGASTQPFKDMFVHPSPHQVSPSGNAFQVSATNMQQSGFPNPTNMTHSTQPFGTSTFSSGNGFHSSSSSVAFPANTSFNQTAPTPVTGSNNFFGSGSALGTGASLSSTPFAFGSKSSGFATTSDTKTTNESSSEPFGGLFSTGSNNSQTAPTGRRKVVVRKKR